MIDDNNTNSFEEKVGRTVYTVKVTSADDAKITVDDLLQKMIENESMDIENESDI